MELTDDWGFTYYYSSSNLILDSDKLGHFEAGHQYGLLTITVSASVQNAGDLDNALNSVAGKTFNVNFNVEGNAASNFKCTAVGVNTDPTVPTQASYATTSTTNYTEVEYAKNGGSYWVDNQANSKTWANVTHSNQTFTFETAYTGHTSDKSIELVTYKYYIGLSGNGQDENSLKNTALTITPVLTDGTLDLD